MADYEYNLIKNTLSTIMNNTQAVEDALNVKAAAGWTLAATLTDGTDAVVILQRRKG